MQAYHTEDYTDSEGQRFRIEHHYDWDAAPPWEQCDGHGPVSDWTNRDKHPGELVLNSDRHGYKRFYDFQHAIKLAREEDWGCASLLPKHERGEALERAVRADYEYLKAWCDDKWHYMGIEVFPLTEDGDELRSKSQSIWGIESESDPAGIQDVTEALLREAGAEL